MNVAGIDAHTTYLVVVIVAKDGEKILGPQRIGMHEPRRLLEILDAAAPVEIVMETSPTWPWLHDLVHGRPGIGFVLCHATKLRAIAEANYKRDEVDAELLGRMRLAGLIPAVHAKSIDQREQALLVRHWQILGRERTAIANRIHAQLHVVGLRLERGRLLTKKGRRWIRERAWPVWAPEQRRMVRTHFALIDQLTAMRKALSRRIEAVAKQVPATTVLRTVPGIGAYRALLIATEVEPISRFVKPEHLVSYAGLAPRTRQSGLSPIKYGRIPAGANRWLRGALVHAVVTHVQHAPDSELSKFYAHQKERRGWQVARIATARKLARAVHAMLRTGEAWRG